METQNIASNQIDDVSLLKKMKQRRLKRVIVILFGSSLFFCMTTVYFAYQEYALNKLAKAEELNHPDVPVTANQILEALSRHMILPDTVPQIAQVQDAAKIKNSQELFKDVENGDSVIVYETMIIVYRPSKDIIVAVGNVTAK